MVFFRMKPYVMGRIEVKVINNNDLLTFNVVKDTLCEGEKADITVISSIGNTTFHWFNTAISETPFFTGKNYVSGQLLKDTTFYVSSQAIEGCSSDKFPVSIEVNKNQIVANVTADNDTLCKGEGTILRAKSTGSRDFEWYSEPVGGSSIGSGEILNTGSLNSTTTIYVSNVDRFGCEGPRVEYKIVVLENLNTPVTSIVSDTVCNGDSLTITVTSSGPDDYRWFDAEVGGNLLFEGTEFKTGPLSSSRFIFVENSNDRGCVSSRSKVSIVVLPNPVKPTVAGSLNVCFGQSAKLVASSQTSGVSFKWYSDPLLTNLLFTGKEYNPIIISDSTIYVTAKIGDCESDFKELRIKVSPEKVLEIPVVVCDTISGIQEIYFTWNNITGAVGYEVSTDGGSTWKDPSTGFSSNTHRETQSDTAIKNVSLMVRAIGDTVKCYASKSENSNKITCFYPVIQEDTDLKFFFNSFSPNDDGVNDVWYITDGLNKYPDNIVQVFNRWGEVVFETTGYDNEQNVFTGANLPDGSYYYVLRVPSKKFVKSGYVIIMR